MTKNAFVKSLGEITVTAVIPKELGALKNIAYDMWWSWNADAIDLYREIDLELWEKLGKNPIRFLREVGQHSLQRKANDPDYMKNYAAVVSEYEKYMSCKDTWFSAAYPDQSNKLVGYFCAEYGLHEILNLYSGGLGILAGEHCKSASDLGVPIVAVGLFYKQGYFSQRINKDGWQETVFEDLPTSHLPITVALDKNSQEILVDVVLPGRTVFAKVWKIKVGRVSLYLMDTDVPQNSPMDRLITARLYGGDNETRIQQEIFLGIGGVRVLEALELEPSVFHMNEGHSAFLPLELIRKLVQNNKLSFRNAKEVVSSAVVFTTHTPVPAGTDVFSVDLMDKYFGNYWNELGINRHEFLDMGSKMGDNQNFNMTVLALNLAGRRNGVSKLHGAVSRNIFKNVWPNLLEDDVPIGHITNGIHNLTWLSPNVKRLYDKYLKKDWSRYLWDLNMWENIDSIPDDELWETHNVLKIKMLNFLLQKIKEQKLANNEAIDKIKEVDSWMDPKALTIGCARRFATYKRADLIFRDLARIEKILNNADMPVQVIFAGKAHPADVPGHEIIKNIHDIACKKGFSGKVILVENYNMTIARNMVQGVDVWMNNPRRPLEASGTSGQKACINGAINFSVLDGWWSEAYNGINGWAIGDDTGYETETLQDDADSESIYDVLETQIVPLFFYRDKRDVPVKWVGMMKESMKSLSGVFNTDRMVQEYTTLMYLPSVLRMDKIFSSKYDFTAKLADWKMEIEREWPKVQVVREHDANISTSSGQSATIMAKVQLGSIPPSSVTVDLCYGRMDAGGMITEPLFITMNLAEKLDDAYIYNVDLTIDNGGDYGYSFRIMPNNGDLINRSEMNLVKWAT